MSGASTKDGHTANTETSHDAWALGPKTCWKTGTHQMVWEYIKLCVSIRRTTPQPPPPACRVQSATGHPAGQEGQRETHNGGNCRISLAVPSGIEEVVWPTPSPSYCDGRSACDSHRVIAAPSQQRMVQLRTASRRFQIPIPNSTKNPGPRAPQGALDKTPGKFKNRYWPVHVFLFFYLIM